MKLSKSDMAAATLGTALLAGLGYLLYVDITRGAGPGDTELIGTVAGLMNTAERKYSSQVIWGGVDRGSDLYNYDTVRTADRSEALLRLKNGTEIVLAENSMVLLSLTDTDVDIKFMEGAIHTRMREGAARDKKVSITSGESTITMKNGDISLSRDMDSGLQMTVNRGKATLKSGETEKVINENQNIIAGRDEIRLYDLSIRLTAPENNRVIPSTAEKTRVAFSWERLKGDYTTHLEVSANPSVADPLVSERARGAAAAAALPRGVYYWRVTAIHNTTRKIESSEVRRLSILSDRPPQLVLPANRSVINYYGPNPLITFLWTGNESAARYRLLVARRPDLSDPVVNMPVDLNRIALNSLAEGTYHWRVKEVTGNEDSTAGSDSPVFTFTVSRTEKIEPPEPIYPPDRNTIHPLAITQKGMNFSWARNQALAATEILVASDTSFSNIILKKTTPENFTRFNDPLQEGTYYWRLRGTLSGGSTTEPSRVMQFRVARQGTIALIEPKDRAIIVTRDNEQGIDVSFSWSRSELEGNYSLQISTDRNFSTVSKELSVSDLSASLKNLAEGAHYWRVRQTDQSGNEMMTSPVRSFEILSLLDRPVPLTPAHGSVINMQNRDAIDFAWRPVKGANSYRIGIFQVKNGIQRAVATMETRNTRYRFADMKKLDEGGFVWTLQARETDPAGGRLRRKSDDSRAAFSITLGLKRKDIEIKSPRILYLE